MPSPLYHPIPQDSVEESAVNSEESGESLEPLEPNVTLQLPTKVWWVHFIFGCAVLLPWNALITATPYFLSRLSGSSLRSAFASYLSTAFTGISLVAVAYTTLTAKQASSNRRIAVSLFGLSFLNFLLSIGTFFRVAPGLFFFAVISNAVLQSGIGAFLQTSVFVIASLFGPAAMQAVMAGQAAVGVAVSGVQVISSAASVWGSNPILGFLESDGIAEGQSAFIFFALSTLFFMLTLSTHRWLTTFPDFKTIVQPSERRRKRSASSNSHALSTGRESDGLSRIMRIGRANWIFELSLFSTFLITLAVFPAITTSIQPTNPRFHPLLFSALHFLVFNVGDLLGRFLCSLPRFRIWSAKNLLIRSLLRAVFIPFFLMCNLQRGITSPNSSPRINSDLLFMVLLFVFAMTGGYLASMAMMAAPSLENNTVLNGQTDDVDTAATVASFSLMAGLAFGSMASFAVRGAICGCNPFTE